MEQDTNLSGYIKEISREEYEDRMQDLEIIGIRVVLKEN